MNITLCGAQGVGKTTLLEAAFPTLKIKLGEDKIKTYTSVSRNAVYSHGVKLNKETDIESQLKLFQIHLIQLHEPYEHKFFDRGFIDQYAYAVYKFPQYADFFKWICVQSVWKYDKVFYIPIEFPVVADGIRDTDENYRKEIDLLIRAFFLTFGCRKPWITLHGSIGHRVELFLKEVLK